MNIVLIAGWGLGASVLTPFADLLRQQQHQVEVWDIFDPNELAVLEDKVENVQAFDILMGWSLGGQLALLLAHEIYQQTGIVKPVICCMSNPCFVAHEHWPYAMPSAQYRQFHDAVMQHPAQALQRFCALVTLGSPAPRERAKLLQQQILNIDLNYQSSHLYLLEQLNLVDILKVYPGKMLFVFSEKDMLVPGKVTGETGFLPTEHLEVACIEAAHDAILFDREILLAPILEFLTNNEAVKAK